MCSVLRCTVLWCGVAAWGTEHAMWTGGSWRVATAAAGWHPETQPESLAIFELILDETRTCRFWTKSSWVRVVKRKSCGGCSR